MRLRLLKLKRTTWRLIHTAVVVCIATLLSQSREVTELESILALGEIKLVTRPGPITYYEDARGENGFDYLLARDFATYLGVELKVTATETLSQVFNMLGGPNADFAGATLTVTPERLGKYRFSDPYGEVVQTVIHRKGTRSPTTVADLLGKQLAVVADSSHEELLRELRAGHPGLAWIRVEGVEMIELVEMVEAGEIDYAIIDSTTFDAHRTMYPNTTRGLDISAPQQLAWAFPRHSDDSLVLAANRFLEIVTANGRLAELHRQFFTDIEHFSVAGSLLFQKRLQTHLPKYRDFFRETARELGIDWHLLAAIAYQESHWNPQAVSPTGVKGMMMLTHGAASEVAVSDRTDPWQSIRGGAQYYLQTKARIPDDIVEPDRTWFALAAYNVGLGHLEDARVLTERAGRDPHLWQDVKDYLPLLQRRKYYATVRHGYARGQEPVNYVRNVIKYTRLLQWNTIEENRRNQREERNTPPEHRHWDLDSFRTL
jgi:membrane-bound lytic murein transglycosylase F